MSPRSVVCLLIRLASRQEIMTREREREKVILGTGSVFPLVESHINTTTRCPYQRGREVLLVSKKDSLFPASINKQNRLRDAVRAAFRKRLAAHWARPSLSLSLSPGRASSHLFDQVNPKTVLNRRERGKKVELGDGWAWSAISARRWNNGWEPQKNQGKDQNFMIFIILNSVYY